ncbi:hypothetical protein ACIQ9P_26235 [Kitasatospora sp. NPDC094019]|uniref:hypothetical protein n=1 Tax=Kitasatospora sp. NPDC094019 TaxID=3364091 RepID=UPI003804F609
MTVPTTPTNPPGDFARALREVGERRARRRRRLAVIGLPLLVAAGASAWLWKPWQSVELPESACWSMVTKEDLKPLAGDDGTAHVVERGDLSGKPSGSCAVRWNGPKGRALLNVSVLRVSEHVYTSVQNDTLDPGRDGHPRLLAFGAGAGGVITSDSNVDLVLRCSESTADSTDGPSYRQVVVSGAPANGTSGAVAVREAHVRLAWHIAAAAIDREGCRGTALASEPPATPAP